MIEITVNGEAREVDDNSTVLQFLHARGLNERTVVVEYNGEILKRTDFETTLIASGANLEVVQMMAGG